jgi:hypothetical protein
MFAEGLEDAMVARDLGWSSMRISIVFTLKKKESGGSRRGIKRWVAARHKHRERPNVF